MFYCSRKRILCFFKLCIFLGIYDDDPDVVTLDGGDFGKVFTVGSLVKITTCAYGKETKNSPAIDHENLPN